jgi:hypothetical protein
MEDHFVDKLREDIFYYFDDINEATTTYNVRFFKYFNENHVDVTIYNSKQKDKQVRFESYIKNQMFTQTCRYFINIQNETLAKREANYKLLCKRDAGLYSDEFDDEIIEEDCGMEVACS